jgi:tellurite resistance protein TerC
MLPWAILAAAVFAFLWIDLKLFARGREPSFREGAVWSVGWLVLSLLVVLVVWPLRGSEDAVEYLTVYLVERSLSLDNLFVFLLLFAYFAIPTEQRPRLLFWGIVAALVMRGGAILGGVALIEQFHFVVYILGATLLLLAYKIFKSSGEEPDPGKNPVVRLLSRTRATPLMICFAAIVLADIAFAVDSIPAAFGITRDPFVIWMGNVFALLGLRALFVLVEGLAKRFRYLDETIAVVLGIVGVFVVAIVGNAAEHYVAVVVARKDKMDLSVNIAIGSSAQVALFVAPVLVLCSFFLGPHPMALVFNGFELGAILVAILIANHVTGEGESNWYEGVQLMAVYAVLAAAFFAA